MLNITRNIQEGIKVLLVAAFLGSFLVAEAALPSGQYGWYLPEDSIVTPGEYLGCGETGIRVDLLVYERDADTPVSVDSALLMVVEKSDGSVTDYVEGVGPSVSGVCYDPDTQNIAIDIDGGTDYYDIQATHIWEDSALVARKRHVAAKVWVTPSTYPSPEYEQIYPLGEVGSSSPAYQFDINYTPLMYAVSFPEEVRLVVSAYDASSTPGSNIVYNDLQALDGSTGRQTLPPLALPDGVYQWGMQVALDGNFSLGDAVNDVPLTGFSGYSLPFTLDTVAPSSTVSHFPANPTNLQTVTLRGDVEEELSGVRRIDIYLDAVRERTCLFADKNTATCTYTAGPFAGGESHNYEIIATDAAGNSTSTTGSFTVTTQPSPLPLSCTSPLPTVLDSAQADGGAAGFGSLDTLKKVGNLIYTGSFGGANGMFIFDVSDATNIVQRSYFSTDSPLLVRNNWWGNDVMGLTVEGNYAYLVTLYGGLVIVDVSNPDAPTFVGKRALHDLNPPDTRESWNVEVRGDYAYVAGGAGMLVVDVTNKANPIVVANVDVGSERSADIVLSGNYAYIALGKDGFTVMDITDPLNPFEVVRMPDIYSPLILAYALAIKDEHLYVSAHFSNKIRVYNITNPESPVYLTSVDADAPTGGAPRYLYVEGDVLYAGSGEGGAYVFDLGTPSTPILLYNIDQAELGGTAKVWDVLPLSGGDFTELVMVSRTTDASVYTTVIECAPAADLKAATPTVSSGSVMQGDTITLSTGDILNRGTAAAPSHNLDGFLVDVDNDDVSDLEVSIPRQESSTDIDDTYEIDVAWVVPTTTVPGTEYRIRYIIDENYEVEANGSPLRNNNDSGWSSPFTVTAYTQTGSITTTDCVIPSGDSSCDVNVSWDSNNFIGAPSVRQGGVEFSSSASGNDVAQAATPDDRTFSLHDTGGSFSDSVNATVYCDLVSGSVWNGTYCVPPPPPCPEGSFYHTDSASCKSDPGLNIQLPAAIDLSRIWVRQGRITTLDYSVTADYVVTCTLYDGSIPAYAFVHDGTVTPVTNGTYMTRPSLSAQIIKLSCLAAGMSTPEEFEFRVNVVPNVQES